MNLNKAIIVGRLTQNPETRSLPSGQNVASFGIATNRVWTNQSGNRQEDVEFHNISAFGKLADICSQYLNKGQMVLIEGRIQTRSWQDQQGNKKQRTEIIANNMQMGPRASGSSNAQQNQQSSNNTSQQPQQSQANSSPSNNSSNNQQISQEEIPVIDSETAPSPEPETQQEEETNQEQDRVDVKNIPF